MRSHEVTAIPLHSPEISFIFTLVVFRPTDTDSSDVKRHNPTICTSAAVRTKNKTWKQILFVVLNTKHLAYCCEFFKISVFPPAANMFAITALLLERSQEKVGLVYFSYTILIKAVMIHEAHNLNSHHVKFRNSLRRQCHCSSVLLASYQACAYSIKRFVISKIIVIKTFQFHLFLSGSAVSRQHSLFTSHKSGVAPAVSRCSYSTWAYYINR